MEKFETADLNEKICTYAHMYIKSQLGTTQLQIISIGIKMLKSKMS